MVGSSPGVVWLLAAAVALVATGCGCPDPVREGSCGESFCALPSLEVGHGASSFGAVADGEALPITRGPQLGYHVDLAASMSGLCEVILLETEVVLDGGGDGASTTQSRIVRAVRGEVGSNQDFWGVIGELPCGWWPDDPDVERECDEGAGSLGDVESVDVVVRARVADDVDAEPVVWLAEDERRVRLECCQ